MVVLVLSSGEHFLKKGCQKVHFITYSSEASDLFSLSVLSFSFSQISGVLTILGHTCINNRTSICTNAYDLFICMPV